MNLAILIGVCDYDIKGGNLPGCKFDIEEMHSLLLATKKYHEILCIKENTRSSDVKQKLTAFIQKYENLLPGDINEIFFYFTGHGNFFAGEFHYLLSDFNQKQRNTTSLHNTEIDNLIKSLSPTLTVKVVDACHSGVSYIKDNSAFEKYLHQQSQGFKFCYFLFSSGADQSSYQSKEMSYFTKSFIESVKNHPGVDIRYKDIMDYISDDFANDGAQTPFFIVQAKFTERFGSVSPKDKNNLLIHPVIEEKDSPENWSIVEKVKYETASYCTREDLSEAFNKMMTFVEGYTFPTVISELYNVNIDYIQDEKEIPDIESLGNWLNKEEHSYILDIVVDNDSEYRSIFLIRITVPEIPFKAIKIYAKSKYPVLESQLCIIFPIFTKKEIRFLSLNTNYIIRGWDEEILNTNTVWQYSDSPIKPFTVLIENLESVLISFVEYIENLLDGKYNDEAVATTEDEEESNAGE